jgi:hypothetical protein
MPRIQIRVCAFLGKRQASVIRFLLPFASNVLPPTGPAKIVTKVEKTLSFTHEAYALLARAKLDLEDAAQRIGNVV